MSYQTMVFIILTLFNYIRSLMNFSTYSYFTDFLIEKLALLLCIWEVSD